MHSNQVSGVSEPFCMRGRPNQRATIRWSMCVLLILFCGLLGLNIANAQPFDPLGKWKSERGFSVAVRSDYSYEFCDRSRCTLGRYIRPGTKDGFAVTLIGFFEKPNAGRIRHVLDELGFLDRLKINGRLSDFDFSVNSGLAGASPTRACHWKPCIYFGDWETEGPYLAFTKQ